MSDPQISREATLPMTAFEHRLVSSGSPVRLSGIGVQTSMFQNGFAAVKFSTGAIVAVNNMPERTDAEIVELARAAL
jgi:hypothetical protein